MASRLYSKVLGRPSNSPLHGTAHVLNCSAGMTAMLNMHNAVPFLEEGRFVPPQQAMAMANGPKVSGVRGAGCCISAQLLQA